MIVQVLNRSNLMRAYRRVAMNKGSAGKMVLQFKYNNTRHITRVKSVLNDFNEDLSLKKGKHPRYVLQAHKGEQVMVMRDNPGKSPDISPGNKLNMWQYFYQGLPGELFQASFCSFK